MVVILFWWRCWAYETLPKLFFLHQISARSCFLWGSSVLHMS